MIDFNNNIFIKFTVKFIIRGKKKQQYCYNIQHNYFQTITIIIMKKIFKTLSTFSLLMVQPECGDRIEAHPKKEGKPKCGTP